MTVRPNVGLLTTPGAPFAGRLLRDLQLAGVAVKAIIQDGKGLSERDQEIHRERTAGRLPSIPLASFENTIPIHHVDSHNDPETASLIRDLQLDVIVNSETPRILRAPILTAPRIGILNCHPGILPEFRGRTCVEWALYYRKPVGNTVHLMVEEIDAGPIVLSEATDLSGVSNYVDVRVRVFESGVRLLARSVAEIHFGRLGPEKFVHQIGGQFHDVIDDSKFAEVEAGLLHGNFEFQTRTNGGTI